MEASTRYSLPKNFRIVFALVGDSTITNFCPDELMAPYIYCLRARVKSVNSRHPAKAMYIALGKRA